MGRIAPWRRGGHPTPVRSVAASHEATSERRSPGAGCRPRRAPARRSRGWPRRAGAASALSSVVGNADEVEGVDELVRGQSHQRAGDGVATEGGEHDLAERPEIRRRQPGQLVGDHRLDGGVADEGGEPGMRMEPLAVGAQRLLQRREPVEVVEVGQVADAGRRPVVGQSASSASSSGGSSPETCATASSWKPPAGRRGQHGALQPVEAVISDHEPLVVAAAVAGRDTTARSDERCPVREPAAVWPS